MFMTDSFAEYFGKVPEAILKPAGDPGVTAGANIHHKYPVFGATPYSFPKHLTFPQTYSHQSP